MGRRKQKDWRDSQVFSYLSAGLAVVTICLGMGYEAKFNRKSMENRIEKAEIKQERVYKTECKKEREGFFERVYLTGKTLVDRVFYSSGARVFEK